MLCVHEQRLSPVTDYRTLHTAHRPGEELSKVSCSRLDIAEFLSRIHFYEMHIFKYSIRQGTRAADMPDQVPEEVKTARSAQLMELSEKMSLEFREHYLDSEQEVLFEELCQVDGEDYYTGYTKEYVKIGVKSKDHLENVIKSGKIIGKISTDILLMGE